jgi:HEAT repeat protein
VSEAQAQEEAGPRRKLRIRDGADLFEALTSPNLGTRISVLGAIARYPERAAEYAKAFDPDLVTWLLQEATTLPDGTLRGATLDALFAFDDDRIRGFIQGEFMRPAAAAYVLSLVPRLQREPAGLLYPLFRQFLRGEAPRSGHSAHARAAATVLAPCSELTPTERIQVATRVETTWAPPPLDAETEAIWLEELDGENEARAKTLLRAQGQSALEPLATCWEHLSRPHQAWLLEWAAEDGGASAVDLLRRALEGEEVDAILIALAHAKKFSALAPAVARLEAHPSASVRAAATAAGAGSLEGCRERVGAGETPLAVRLASIKKLEAAPSPANHAVLAAALQHPHWQVRSAAASALIAHGEEVLPLVEPLVASSDAGVKMAAIQVLIGFERESWLEEKLLS